MIHSIQFLNHYYCILMYESCLARGVFDNRGLGLLTAVKYRNVVGLKCGGLDTAGKCFSC